MAEILAPPKPHNGVYKENVELYNQHDLFEKLQVTPVTIESSIKDVFMNYLRGKKYVKVVVDFREITPNNYSLRLYDINNTGTTPYIVNNQLLYVVGSVKRILHEVGKLGVHGVGLKQLIAKITTQDSIEKNGGITVLTHRVDEIDNKHYELSGVNIWDTNTKPNKSERYLDSVEDSKFPFVSGLEPTENYLAIDIPGINIGIFEELEDKNSTFLEVFADMVATYFVKALDEKIVSFHFRKHDLDGNVEEIDVTEGAKFIDQYGNFIPYSQIPKVEFPTSKDHKYTGRYLQSTKLTPDLKNEAKRKEIRIFGDIPQLGLNHADDWRGYVIDTTETAGVVLGEFGEGRAAGHPFVVMFLETSVENVGTDSNKNSVTLPGTRRWRLSEGDGVKIKGQDGKYYRPVTRRGDINNYFKLFAKQCNPNQQFKETSRRDLGRRLLMGDIPYIDDRFITPAISIATIKEFLSLYNISMVESIEEFQFPKEVKLIQGRKALDLAVIKEDWKIANEWKKLEKDIDLDQILAELLGWFVLNGEYPDEFMITCDSQAESIPLDSHSNFSQDTKDLVEDLKTTFPQIKWTLVDTRYFELNKKYSYFKSYR